MAIAIKVENVSKVYQLGQFSTGTLSRDIERAWYRFRGKDDPFLKVGQTNDRTVKGESDIVWSLRDINFEVGQGDALGIIGRNGAGKSTLLKILSKITAPTLGTIKIKGRIASLLEVGTGFHPELTGEENIFLNGAILGMRKTEIKRRFDEIVDFAGVERYLDTPVKRYSSGMYVRLAFAVAAHLESEILVIDEVLAVGDAEFQRKCLGKMGEVSKGEGRTVLFVSHNMASIQTLCNKGILMKDGILVHQGAIEEVVSQYLTEQSSGIDPFYRAGVAKAGKIVWVREAYVTMDDVVSSNVLSGKDIKFHIDYESMEEDINISVFLGVYNTYGEKLLHLGLPYGGIDRIRSSKSGSIICKIPKLPLTVGKYTVNISLHVSGAPYERTSNAISFMVNHGDFFGNGRLPDEKENKFLVQQEWSVL